MAVRRSMPELKSTLPATTETDGNYAG